MKEIWKPSPTFPERYEVSNYGRFRSLYRKQGRNTVKRDSPRIVKQYEHYEKGYMNVVIKENGVKKTRGVHRLVAKAFIPNPEKKPQVNHIDSNKTNNHVSNLEWVTASENVLHSYNSGSHKRGEKHKSAKLSKKDVLHIREKFSDKGYKYFMDKHNVTRGCIYAIINRLSWNHI